MPKEAEHICDRFTAARRHLRIRTVTGTVSAKGARIRAFIGLLKMNLNRVVEKMEKWKKIPENKILLRIIIAFAIAPAMINAGLIGTDIIYEQMGFSCTAQGLNNAEWLDFWKQYLAIAISFVGISLVYLSSNRDREKQLYEKDAQQYLDGVKQEENVLVEVTQSFDTGVVYEAFLRQTNVNPYEGRKALADARKRMNDAHIKFEILTELCDDFQKGEVCSFSPCADKAVRLALRDLFYDMEKHYFSILETGEHFLTYLNQEQERIRMLDIENQIQSNTERILDLYLYQGLEEEANVYKAELEKIKERIKGFEKSKLETEETNKFLKILQKEIDCIAKELRPKFIRHCKAYMDMKKAYAMELRETGHISQKENECK